MSNEIRIKYSTVDEAIAALVKLSAKIDGHTIDSDLGKTQGKTRGDVDRLVDELKTMKTAVATLVENTREALRNADATFKEADERAAQALQKVGG